MNEEVIEYIKTFNEYMLKLQPNKKAGADAPASFFMQRFKV